MDQPLTFQVRLPAPFDQAMEKVISALKQEGFGVLTRIDVRSTLKEKIAEDFRPYVILGACNPPLAHRALTADASVGVMLPCNVTVEAIEGEILVSLANPEGMLTMGAFAENAALQQVAQEAKERIRRVASHLEVTTIVE